MFERLLSDKERKEVQDRLDRLERRVSALEIDWTDTLDRLKRMQGRIIKERSRAEAANPAQLELSDEDVASGHTGLSQRQESINAQILARRNRLKQ